MTQITYTLPREIVLNIPSSTLLQGILMGILLTTSYFAAITMYYELKASGREVLDPIYYFLAFVVVIPFFGEIVKEKSKKAEGLDTE